MRTALQSLSEGVLEFNPQATPAERRFHSCSDKRAELQTVATWAAGLHRTAPTATIGIVLSDMAGDRIALEYLLRREFDCLGDSYNSLPVNFSTGITLTQAPLVRDALAALAMGLQHTTVPAVVSLLRSRFLDIPDAHSALAQRLVARLYTEGQQALSVSDLRDTAANVRSGDGTGAGTGAPSTRTLPDADIAQAGAPLTVGCTLPRGVVPMGLARHPTSRLPGVPAIGTVAQDSR